MWDASTVLDPSLPSPSLSELRQAITAHYLIDEEHYLKKLMALLDTQPAQLHALTHQATDLVNQVRQHAKGGDGVDALLQQYSLDTQEGIVLMCLAASPMPRLPMP